MVLVFALWATVLANSGAFAQSKTPCLSALSIDFNEPLTRPLAIHHSQDFVTTPHGRLEQLTMGQREVSIFALLKGYRHFSNQLGVYESEKPNSLWLPDVHEFNYRVRRLLALNGQIEPLVTFQSTPGAASSNYETILSKNGFPFGVQPVYRAHDVLHGTAIVVLTLSWHGRQILKAAYERIQTIVRAHRKACELMPHRTHDLELLTFTGLEGWGPMLSVPCNFIERGTFGIAEILIGSKPLIAVGNTRLEQLTTTLNILAVPQASQINMTTLEITFVPWNARRSEELLKVGPYNSRFTGTEKKRLLKIWDDVDNSMPPVPAGRLRAAAQEIESLLLTLNEI